MNEYYDEYYGEYLNNDEYYKITNLKIIITKRSSCSLQKFRVTNISQTHRRKQNHYPHPSFPCQRNKLKTISD